MALNPIENIILSLIDLLRGSITVAIPLFILLLIGQKFRKRIEKETKWSWIKSSFAATFIIMFILMLLGFFYPFLAATQEQALGEVPSIFAPSLDIILLSFVAGIFKALIVALVATLILMPLEFVGLYFHEVISKKLGKQPEWLKLLVTAYVSSVFGSAIILFLVPELIPGILFYLYFG